MGKGKGKQKTLLVPLDVRHDTTRHDTAHVWLMQRGKGNKSVRFATIKSINVFNRQIDPSMLQSNEKIYGA